MPATRLIGLTPMLGDWTRVIVFGSFPGVRSLQAKQYYAHPQNQFWKLLGEVLEEPLPAMLYSHRLERLQARGVGLWDVIASCERAGSLDSAIKAPQFQDFVALKARCPQWQLACFNGKAAGAFAPLLAGAGLQTAVLPSSSAANAGRSFLQKLTAWQNALHTSLQNTA